MYVWKTVMNYILDYTGGPFNIAQGQIRLRSEIIPEVQVSSGQ